MVDVPTLNQLDDIQKQREIGKRSYQKILLVIGSAAVTFAVCALIGFSDALLFELIVTCRRT